MNSPSLSVDYGFPDLTEKAGPVEDTGQSQEGASLPSPLPKMSLVEPPWRVVPAEEEEAEQLLPVTRSILCGSLIPISDSFYVMAICASR